MIQSLQTLLIATLRVRGISGRVGLRGMLSRLTIAIIAGVDVAPDRAIRGGAASVVDIPTLTAGLIVPLEGIAAGLACAVPLCGWAVAFTRDRKSTRLNSSHVKISYAVFCLKKK